MTTTANASVFETFQQQAWPYQFKARLHVNRIAGGVPTNPKIAEGWIRSKLQTSDEIIRDMVADAMVARGVDPSTGELDREAVIEQVAALKSLNGFKRDDTGLYIEGRQVKAALKEAVSCAVSVEKVEMKGWGSTRKWLTKFFPEHVFVLEDKLHLHDAKGKPILDPTNINQRFVTNKFNQRAIQYEEYVEDASIEFTVVSDYDFSDEDWAMIWMSGEKQGIGAARSAGFGVYTVTKWEKKGSRAARTRTRSAHAKKTAKKG